ncbi:MAG: PKD domain-containing protein, partial [Bdellovibrionales bacterium]|nr:PKD domain-containing protein [Bdellovibrionales bacterium]
ADETYGGIAIITKYMSGLCSSSNCGGVAYRDAIPSSSYYRHFAFVFANNLANNARYMGEAISHELGHNLGLSHDGKDSSSYYYGHGSGETAWAPIMGAGYFKNLVQWSKGEYSNASNTQDDITLISAILGGRDDDHGDARGDATLLNDEEVVLEGIVETSGDQDVFEFFAEPDPVVFSVAPALFGPSVDLQVTLLDEAGQVLAESNPPDLLAAQIDFEIPAKGAYYLVVQGTGKGDPLADGYSEYGSIGSYSIQGSFSRASFAPEAAIAVSQQQINQFRFSAADSNDVDGSILQYQWNFGDGNIVTGEEVEHSYSNPGKYVVQLEVIDEDQLSATATRTIEVNAAPVAIAITDVLSGTGPLKVQFDASSSVDTDGIIVSYQWDFDGKSITGVFAQHTFKGLGTYPVSLTVTDDKGASTVSTLSIVVHESEQVPGNESDPGKGEDANRAPIVTFKADALTTTVPRIVSFNGAKSMDLDGQLVAFDWDFGDGQRGEGALIEHTFMAEGTYSVVLTVTDDKGAKGNATSTITIEDIKTCDAASIKAAKNKFRKSYQKSCRKRFQLKSAARVRTCSINWKKMYKRKYGSSDCGAS